MVIQALLDMDQLNRLLEETPDVVDRPHAPNIQPLLLKQGLAPTAVPCVEFRNVYFHYPSQKPAHGLKGINFVVQGGTTTGIVGSTGCGKTTIGRLLFRFYDPLGGKVLIEGVDVGNVTQRSLRKLVGVVPQDTTLFNNTILFNVKYGRPAVGGGGRRARAGSRGEGAGGPQCGDPFIDDVVTEEVRAACKSAQILEFIESLPEGWSTTVGERGLKLSGGEKQRIAIARALLKDPPIVLLDEATSALDSTTEREVQGALGNLAQNRTTLVIAHRLSTVMFADQILVMGKGAILEKGTHTELMAIPGGKYAEMWGLQLKQEEEAHYGGVGGGGISLGGGVEQKGDDAPAT